MVTAVEGAAAAEVAEDVEAVAAEGAAVAGGVDEASRAEEAYQDARDAMTQECWDKYFNTIKLSASGTWGNQNMGDWPTQDARTKRDKMAIGSVMIVQMV